MSHSIESDQSSVLFPDVLGHKPTDGGIILSLRIPAHLAYFDGHFDEIAIVPGVAQIQWAVHFARQYLGLNQSFSHMEAVKFKELLRPGQRLELGLQFQAEPCKLEFWYRSDASEYSSGRIYFHDDRV